MFVLQNTYPIVIAKGNHKLTITVKENQNDKIDVDIDLTRIGDKVTTKCFSYEFDYENDALEEAIYHINEGMNRAVLFSDGESESSFIDILIELDKLKRKME